MTKRNQSRWKSFIEYWTSRRTANLGILLLLLSFVLPLLDFVTLAITTFPASIVLLLTSSAREHAAARQRRAEEDRDRNAREQIRTQLENDEIKRVEVETEQLNNLVAEFRADARIYDTGHQRYQLPVGRSFYGLIDERRRELNNPRWILIPLIANATPEDVRRMRSGWMKDFEDFPREIRNFCVTDHYIYFDGPLHKAITPAPYDRRISIEFPEGIKIARSVETFRSLFVEFAKPCPAEIAIWEEVAKFIGVNVGVLRVYPDRLAPWQPASHRLYAYPPENEPYDEDVLRAFPLSELCASLTEQIFAREYSRWKRSLVPPELRTAEHDRAERNDIAMIAECRARRDELGKERYKRVHQAGYDYVLTARDRFRSRVNAWYRDWAKAWVSALRADGEKPITNDDAYIAKANPERAAVTAPPLEPFQGVSEHLWWKHHVLHTAERVPGHLFLGCITAEPTDPPTEIFKYSPRRPLYLNKSILHHHLYDCGRTGGGKTSLIMLPMALQLIRGSRTRDGRWSDPDPVFIIDLAGDEVLFHETRRAAEERGQRFRFFTAEKNQATYRFNPFAGFNHARYTTPELAQMFLDALALNHGSTYGRGYFSKVAQDLFTETLARRLQIRTFSELAIAIEKTQAEVPRFKTFKKDGSQLLTTMHTLKYYPMLVTRDGEDYAEDVINFDRALQEREVVYFWLRAPVASISVREIGGLALLNLSAAAIDRKRDKPADRRQAYLFIDEFQQIMTEHFPTMLRQLRHQRIAAILANQSLDELLLPNGFDLRPTIRDNTRVKVFFDVEQPNTFRFYNALASGLTPAAAPFPSQNSFDTSHLYSEGTSASTTEGASRSRGTTFGDSYSANESHGGSDTQSDGRFESYSMGDSSTDGASDGQSRTWEPLFSEERHGEQYGQTRSRSTSSSRSSGSTSSRARSASWSSGSGWTSSQSTSDSESTSSSKTSGRSEKYPRFGNRYAGFAVRTTWHIPEAEMERITALTWPHWNEVPGANRTPPTDPQPESTSAKSDPKAGQEQQERMEEMFDSPPKKDGQSRSDDPIGSRRRDAPRGPKMSSGRRQDSAPPNASAGKSTAQGKRPAENPTAGDNLF